MGSGGLLVVDDFKNLLSQLERTRAAGGDVTKHVKQ